MRNLQRTIYLSRRARRLTLFSLMFVSSIMWMVGHALGERPGSNRSGQLKNGSRSGGGTVAVPCTDNDNDGYGIGCVLGPDCDDNDSSVNPGETEICNGKDDNCDGQTDEGFSFMGRDGTSHCFGGGNDGSLCKQASDCSGGFCKGDDGVFGTLGDLPLGRQCLNGLGICMRVGTVVCSADHLSAICDAVPGDPDPRGEGCQVDMNGVAIPDPGDPTKCLIDKTAATCFDRLDNDCDGLVDHGDSTLPSPSGDTNCTGPELCNGFDDDNNGVIDDGLGLGAPCTAGVGACKTDGEIVCDDNGGTKCSAIPLPPANESGPGSARCTDGIDNDCDGKIDLVDPGCQEPEKCDGKDNDGDGVVDNGFYPNTSCSPGAACPQDLGELCTAGTGACLAYGVKICSGDGLSTVCSAIPGKGLPEGPTGATCSDGIDNDCDGLTDMDDPGCTFANLQVTCALLSKHDEDDDYENPQCAISTDDLEYTGCVNDRTLVYKTNEGDPSLSVVAELLAVDATGQIVSSYPVDNGDRLILTHRSDAPVSESAVPPSASELVASFNNIAIGQNITISIYNPQRPRYIYLHARRHPDHLDVEDTPIKAACDGSLVIGKNYGSFKLISVDSWSPPRYGAVCSDGVRSMTLQYTGTGPAMGASIVDVVVSVHTDRAVSTYNLTAPIPMVRVTAQSGQTMTQAFCSPIPALSVISPSNTVVSGSAGNELPVFVAIPGVDPTTLKVTVDGVDILGPLGIQAVRDFPGGPFSGNVNIGGDNVEIDDLKVLTAPFNVQSPNTLSMTVKGLGCGGHFVKVTGDPPPVCTRRLARMSLRYDGGGCEGSQNAQCPVEAFCAGGAGFTSPVRVIVKDHYENVIADSGSPPSMNFGDSLDVLANDVTDGALPCQVTVQILDNSGVIEQSDFRTLCKSPIDVGSAFGSLRVIGLESSTGNYYADDCYSADDPEDGVHLTHGQVTPVDPPKGNDPKGDPHAVCYKDDINGVAQATVFLINIDEPIAGEITPPGPVHVTGQACHGVPITGVNVNGFQVDLGNQQFTPGDGVNTGDKYVQPIDIHVPITDLHAAVLAQGGGPGTFDPGSNRLIAQAIDGDFNAVYDSFYFAVGPVIPGPAPATASASAYTNTATDPSFVDRAFVFAITTDGATNFFDAMKNHSKKCLGDRAKDALKRTPTKEKKLKVDGACDPPTKMIVNNTEITLDQFSLDVTADDSVTADPREGIMHVKIGLPPVDITAHFSGYCQSGCVCAFGGCACAVCVTVNIDGRFNQKNMSVSFDVDRPHLLQGNLPRDQRDKLKLNFDLGESDPNDFTKISGDVDIGCLLGFILDVIDFFFTVVTFGLWDPSLSDIDFQMTGDQIEQRLNAQDGDPMDTDFVKFKNKDLPQYGTREKDSKITDVAIGHTGIAVTIGAGFAPDAADIDPQAANIPGTPLRNAPIPVPPILDAGGQPVEDVTIAIAVDVFNQLFYSMVQTGKLKTQFEVSKQLGTLLPPDCAAIEGNTSTIDSNREARCVGFQGGDCTQFPLLSEFRRQCRRGSRIGRNTNIRTGTNIIFHGSVQNPPILLLDDDPSTPEVEVTLRYPQISLYLIADRANDQVVDTGSVDTLPMCTFGDLDADNLPDSTATSDCLLWEFCMTIDLNVAMQFDINPDTGKERLKFNFLSINRDTPYGVACNGSSDTIELDFLNGEAGKSQTFDLLQDKLKDNTPPLDQDGLDLGGFVSFTGKRIVAIKTQPPAQDDGFQDYVGITGTIEGKPVDPNAGCDENP